jgi:hypothetical protein
MTTVGTNVCCSNREQDRVSARRLRGHLTSAMQAVTAFFYLSPLLVLQGGQSVSGFSTEQAQALALVLIK